MRKGLVSLVVLITLAAIYATAASRGVFGNTYGRGVINPSTLDPDLTANRTTRQRIAAATVGAPAEPDDKQILFGDLHVHTTFSFDAFNISLPMVQGEGSHPPADACDYARFCSSLDFWSINDHAEGLTPAQWRETREMVRECNAVSGDPDLPDLVTFLGWEWTQIGSTPENHYGHKNVILRDTAEGSIPTRPVSSREQLFPNGENPYNAWMRLFFIASAPGGNRQAYHDFARFLQERDDLHLCKKGPGVRDLPDDCQESASTPTGLFERLDDWGFPYMVIPHGNTWGFYTPPLISWDKQLQAHDDPEKREFLIEVFSGHGNIEEYRDWRALERTSGGVRCPEPIPGFTAECWRAGEIIRERCKSAGEAASTCEARAVEARSHHVEARDAGHLTVPGHELEDWLDAGQCTDCYMPAYNHRPGGSVQAALALRDFSNPEKSQRFRFGMIGSSDIHSARPGTGYKEMHRRKTTDAALGNLGPPAILMEAEPEPRSLAPADVAIPSPYFERFASFFGAGGLAAVHSTGRDRNAIWEALERKEVYATSGDRILLWFNLIGENDEKVPMGSSTIATTAPVFEVRAVGAFEQKPGCPEDTLRALASERLERLCGGECYHPSDQRKRIDRIEVIRIRPQSFAGENLASLIDDPWRVIPCPSGNVGCQVTFSDPDFLKTGRDSLYYVRAIQEASPTMNANNLRCTRDEQGNCLDIKPCRASAPTSNEDDCLADAEERAWSSPIFVDHASISASRSSRVRSLSPKSH